MDRHWAHVPHIHVDDWLERRSRSGGQHRDLATPRHPEVLQGKVDDSREPPTLHSSFGIGMGLMVSCGLGKDSWDGQVDGDQ